MTKCIYNIYTKQCIYIIYTNSQLKGGEFMSRVLTAFRMEPELMEELKKIAAKKDRSVSSLVRVVLKNYVEQQNI